MEDLEIMEESESDRKRKFARWLDLLGSEGKITDEKKVQWQEKADQNFDLAYAQLDILYAKSLGCPAMISILAENAIIQSNETEFLYRRLTSEKEAEVRTAINEIIILFDRNRSNLGHR